MTSLRIVVCRDRTAPRGRDLAPQVRVSALESRAAQRRNQVLVALILLVGCSTPYGEELPEPEAGNGGGSGSAGSKDVTTRDTAMAAGGGGGTTGHGNSLPAGGSAGSDLGLESRDLETSDPGPDAPGVCPTGPCQASSVAAGGGHACALLRDGSVLCWGENKDGQLGNSEVVADSPTVPVRVIGVSDATAIAAGTAHTCALIADGRVQCWGSNTSGQLGNNTIENPGAVNGGMPAPASKRSVATVEGAHGAVAMALGGDFTCALMPLGSVLCWGGNHGGLLGVGSAEPRILTPREVQGLSEATSIGAAFSHACARRRDGSVWCWGEKGIGQLGNGLPAADDPFVNPPRAIRGLSNVSAITVGDFGGCALRDDGSVWCWGDGSQGVLGDGSRTAVSTPVAVMNLERATSVSAGYSFACATGSDATVRCWGSNFLGAFGIGVTPNRFLLPVMSGFVGTTNLSSRGGVCAVNSDGAVRCAGYGPSSSTPITIRGF
jgi:alpha-tubulin suppressor-like RCC1 family protein